MEAQNNYGDHFIHYSVILLSYEVQKWKKQYLRYCQETMDYVYIIKGKTCEKKTRGILTGA